MGRVAIVLSVVKYSVEVFLWRTDKGKSAPVKDGFGGKSFDAEYYYVG